MGISTRMGTYSVLFFYRKLLHSQFMKKIMGKYFI